MKMESDSTMNGMAGAHELLTTLQAIKNDLESLQLRVPTTDKTYAIAPFLKMWLCHFPTKTAMKGKGLREKPRSQEGTGE